MADDLGQEELRVRVFGDEEVDLAIGIGVRVRPAAERERVIALAKHLPQLPRVLDRPRRADALVAAEHDQRRKPALVRAVRVRQAVLDRMLRRQERDDAIARDVEAEVGDEVAEVVFFGGADRAVGEEHERALARQPAHGVIGVDPRVHAFRGGELGARRPQLGRERPDGPAISKRRRGESIEIDLLLLYNVP